MYKRLFTIKHNNKSFVIFVNEKHRFVFMEQRGNELVYPDYEDFLYLFNVYNVNHGVLSSTNTLIGDRVLPPEKINYKGLLLSIICSLNLSYVIGTNLAISVKGDNVVVESVEEKKYISPKSVTELNEYLGYRKISVDELFSAIDENDSFNERQREITKNIITEKLKLNPNMDLRLFYENVKTLKIVMSSRKELEERFNEKMDGCYMPSENTIYLTDTDYDLESTFAHEISHVMHGYWRDQDGVVIHFDTGRSSLHEILTNREGQMGMENFSGGYGGDTSDMGRALTYLLKHSDKFSYIIYDEYGLDPLFDELKEKYPNVDIDFIIDFYNAYHRNYVSVEYEEISIFDNEYLLDQFYEMAVLNIDKDNVLGSLKDLIELFQKNEENCKKYSEKYFDYLIDNSLISNDMGYFIKNVDHFVIKDSKLYLGTVDNKYYFGNELRNITDDCMNIPLTQSMKTKIIDDYFMGTSIDEKYLLNLVGEENIFSRGFIGKINEYSEEEILRIYYAILHVMIDNCSSLEETQKQYVLFCDMCSESYRYLAIDWDKKYEINDSALDEYLQTCVDKKFTNEKDNKFIKNINHIINYNGNYYVVKKISNFGGTDYNPNYRNDDYRLSTCLVNGQIRVTYYDENGEEKDFIINRDIFTDYELSTSGLMKVQSFLNSHDTQQLSQEYLSSLIDGCGMNPQHLYDNVFKLSNGEVIYDGELDDSILIEFGKEENRVTYQIIKDNKVLYKSCDNFVPLSSRVSYKLFLKFLDYDENEYMDEILNNSDLINSLCILMPIMKEAKLKWIQYSTAVITEDQEGKTSNSYRKDIDFINPYVINMDGQNCYARDIVFFSSPDDGWLYASFPDGTTEPIFDLNQIEGFFPEDEFIFTDLEDYIELYNLQPNENGIYEMTKEQIIDLVVKDFSEESNQNKSK